MTGAGAFVVDGVVVVVVSSVLPAGRLTPLGVELSDGTAVPVPFEAGGVDEFEPPGVEPVLPVGELPLPGTVGAMVVSPGCVITVTTAPSGVVTIDPSGVVTTADRGSRAMRSASRDEPWMTTARCDRHRATNPG